jgi:hypothetical protein
LRAKRRNSTASSWRIFSDANNREFFGTDIHEFLFFTLTFRTYDRMKSSSVS